MIMNQISVFLENKPGQLSAFVKLLADNKIDLQALSIAESQDYGIVRIIVDKPNETAVLLNKERIPCKNTAVLSVTVPDEPGSLTSILSALTKHNISIKYSYAFYSRTQGHACIILRVEDNLLAEKILKDEGVIS